MPEPSLSHILGFPGYGVERWQAEKARGRLTLGLTRPGKTPYHTCPGCGIGPRDPRDHPTRRVRALPGATGRVWLVVPVYHRACRR